MGENDDQRRPEHGGSILHGAKGRRVDEIAGVSRDKEFTDPSAAKDKLWRHTAVRTAYDGRPRSLVRRDCTSLFPEVNAAQFWTTHISFVARFQRGECLGRGESGRGSIGGMRLPRHAVQPKRDGAGPRQPE